MGGELLLAVAVHRREERRWLEGGVAGVAELLGDGGEGGPGRVGLLGPVAGRGASDPGLDVQALLQRLVRLPGVQLDAVGLAGSGAVGMTEVQVPWADDVAQVEQARS